MKKKLEKLLPSAVEAYRMVRANLFSSAFRTSQTLAVVSSLPGEGKTTIAANVARACADANKHVLLVDANLRTPSLHKRFNLDNEMGLAQALGGSSDQVVVQAVLPRLDVLTAGSTPTSATDRLVSENIEPLVEFLTMNYELVIFDTSPVLKTSDAIALAACVDNTLVVVKSASTRKEQVDETLKQLKRTSTHIIGVVLNRIPSVKEEQESNREGLITARETFPSQISLRPAMLQEDC